MKPVSQTPPDSQLPQSQYRNTEESTPASSYRIRPYLVQANTISRHITQIISCPQKRYQWLIATAILGGCCLGILQTHALNYQRDNGYPKRNTHQDL